MMVPVTPIEEFVNDCFAAARHHDEQAAELRALAFKALYPPEGTTVSWYGRGKIRFSTPISTMRPLAAPKSVLLPVSASSVEARQEPA